MNATNLINSLLSSSKSLLKSGADTIKNNTQDGNLASLGTGALAGGLLAALLGTKGGRKLSKGALKAGSVAALGALAYHAYQNYQKKQNEDIEGEVVSSSTTTHNLASDNTTEFVKDGENNAHVLLAALIAAAKSDGHIDDTEKRLIQQHITTIGESADLQQFIENEINKPLEPAEFAKYADNTALASQIYLLSVMITDDTNFMEKAYLDALATHLNLSPELVTQLQAEVA